MPVRLLFALSPRGGFPLPALVEHCRWPPPVPEEKEELVASDPQVAPFLAFGRIVRALADGSTVRVAE